jgi:hypothetical protein
VLSFLVEKIFVRVRAFWKYMKFWRIEIFEKAMSIQRRVVDEISQYIIDLVIVLAIFLYKVMRH